MPREIKEGDLVYIATNEDPNGYMNSDMRYMVGDGREWTVSSIEFRRSVQLSGSLYYWPIECLRLVNEEPSLFDIGD